MPLHNVIPLCNLKYVRDIYSGATFQYDTTGKINKHEGQKAASVVDRVIEITKISTKHIFTEMPEIDKSMIEGSLVGQNNNININIEYGQEYEREHKLELDVLTIPKVLALPTERGLNKSESQALEYHTLREVNITTSKEFEGVTPLLMDYSHGIKFLNMRELSDINKCTNLNVDIIRGADIDKIIDKNLGAEPVFDLNKSDDPRIMWRDFNKDLNIYKYDPLVEIIPKTEINKYNDNRYIDRINESEINNHKSSIVMDRVITYEISKEDPHIYVVPDELININYDHPTKLVYRDINKQINYNRARSLARITEKLMNKDKITRLFYSGNIRPIDRISLDSYLEPIKMVPVFKIKESYMDRLYDLNVFKIHDKYVDRMYVNDMCKLDSITLSDATIIPLYKEHQKPILNLSIENIYKDHSRSLSGPPVRGLYLPRENKFIEVTKRWWWLNETSPKDHLIVPNKDYGQMIDLLNNDHYEYLRYSSHPIEWGQSWGIDNNIPPAAISIEIMVDLVNIITMICYKNAHGWLNVSGKEAIQLLMELIYDWYNMSTSNPTHDYYRAFRWIRWEAEKVYFLDIKNGLDAIETLVNNLTDYLKFHHFNNVPTWRNPKATDDERNFNRLAQNGDLMNALDKTKGKRHYFIETQNFEKKNKLRG